jgi:hypothetical protein
MPKLTKETRTSDYVCFPCGISYLTPAQKEGEGHAVTSSLSTCGLCGKENIGTTHMRHFNYLNPLTKTV